MKKRFRSMYKTQVPSRDELAAWVIAESERELAAYPQFCVGYTYYKYRHPVGWTGNEAILRHYGYTPTTSSASWTRLMVDITGRKCPTRTDVAKMRQGKEISTPIYSEAPDVPDTPVDRIPDHREPPEYPIGVLRCLAVDGPVRMYDPYRYRSVIVPAEEVVILR